MLTATIQTCDFHNFFNKKRMTITSFSHSLVIIIYSDPLIRLLKKKPMIMTTTILCLKDGFIFHSANSKEDEVQEYGFAKS